MINLRSAAVQLVLVATTVFALLALTSCTESSPPGPTPGSPSAAASPAPSPSSQDTDLKSAGAREITVTGDWLSAGEGGVWLSGQTLIARLDPTSGRQVAEIAVPQGPCQASDDGYGFVWTATCTEGGLARIDPKTNKLSGHLRLDIPDGGEESSIGVGAGSVWVIVDGKDCVACRVARVDARRLRVETMVPVTPNASAVRFGAGHLWVTNNSQDLVERIDPKGERVVDKVQVGSGPRFFAVGEGAVWTLNQLSGTVTRLDIASGDTTEIETPFTGQGGDMTVGGGWVWVRGGEELLGRIDPRTNQLVETYGPDSGSGAVVVGYEAVWISAHDVNIVWRLPLESV